MSNKRLKKQGRFQQEVNLKERDDRHECEGCGIAMASVSLNVLAEAGLIMRADAGLEMPDGHSWAITPKGIRLMNKIEALRATCEPDPLKAVRVLALLDDEGLVLTLEDGDSVLAELMRWSLNRTQAALNEAVALGFLTRDQGEFPGVHALKN